MRLDEIIATIPAERAEVLIEAIREKAASLDRISNLSLGLNPFANSIELNAAKKSVRIMAEMIAEMKAGLGNRKITNNPKDSYRIDL